MGCEHTVVVITVMKDAAPPLPGVPLAERGRTCSTAKRKKSGPCGKPALYYEITGLVSVTGMWLCEEHRHAIASLGAYTLVLTMPPAAQPTEEPAVLPSAYKVPEERGGC